MEYKTVGDVVLTMDVFESDTPPTAGRPAIVFFFGGGWAGGIKAQFHPHARMLAERGMVAFCADYRTASRHGTTPFACVRDGKSAVRYLRAHADALGLDPDRIVAAGGSAGGHVAACTAVIEGHEEPGEETAVSSRPNAMLLFNPVLDTTERGYGIEKVTEARKTEISPCHHVQPGLPPTLILQGTADTTTPPENADRFTRLMCAAGNRCRVVSFQGERHGFFNHGRKDNRPFRETMAAATTFLAENRFLSQPGSDQ